MINNGKPLETGRAPVLRLASNRAAFTLIELLASMAILGLIMVMLFSAFEQISKAWTQGESRVETFTEARAILDLMSRELSQAITTPNITFYGEDHRLYFVAPVDSDPVNHHTDLCEVGYEYEHQETPPLIPPNWTFKITRRLTEPTTSNIGATGPWNFYADSTGWWNDLNPTQSFDPATEATLATNTILNLQFQYLRANGTAFAPPYRSENNGDKLPAAVVIVLDVVDSRTVARLKLVPNVSPTSWEAITNSTLRSFSTVVYLPNATP